MVTFTWYASGILTGSPLSATWPAMPVPQATRTSSCCSISSNVLRGHTSNSFETKHLRKWRNNKKKQLTRFKMLSPRSNNGCDNCCIEFLEQLSPIHLCFAAYFFGASGLLLSVDLPWTKNNEPRSAFSSMETFCKILWHKDRTSSSLQISLTYFPKWRKISANEKRDSIQEAHRMWVKALNSICYLTNSKINCFSSKCFSSLRDNRCGRCGWLDIEFIGFDPDPETISFCELILKNVGVPSIVFTMGFNKPPRSNSCADIFLFVWHRQKRKFCFRFIY